MYTTQKQIKRLKILSILACTMILISIIGIFLENYHNLISFETLGDFLNYIILMGIGIFTLVSSNKRLQKIKDIEFSLNDEEFICKHCSSEFIFNSSQPAKYIKKTLKNIEILTLDGQLILIPLQDFRLDYKELKSIESHINSINKLFQ